MLGNPYEILVRSQERVAVLAASGSNQKVDGAGQHSFRQANRSKLGRSDVGRSDPHPAEGRAQGVAPVDQTVSWIGARQAVLGGCCQEGIPY
ncbi:MAG: hypothetical protein ACREJN_05110 [Nitrospiraceae bacterium]